MVGKIVRPVWGPIVMWFRKHVLGIARELNPAVNGSGDKTFDWVGVLLAAVAGAIATVVWSLVERRRTDHRKLRALLRVVIRYTLAFALLGYGTSKVFCLQFPAPSATRIVQPFGEASPMGLLWTFMGASPVYERFAGAVEVLGGLLLLFRRTTALGAVIDDKQQTMTFRPDPKDREEAALGPMAFHYVRSTPDHLTLEGKVGAVALSVQLEKLDVGKSLLMSRGFHWINEESYNR